MRWTKVRLHLAVSLRTGIGVRHKNRNGSAQRDALKNAGENFASILLLAWSDDVALPWAAPIKIRLDIRFGEWEARRTPINYHTYAATM
jgi:hypothetical protein